LVRLVNDVSSGSEVREDPVKLHKGGTSLYDSGKYKEAIEKFMEASRLYEKVKNFFDASYMLFKAAECSFLLKDYDTAIERFVKSADIALEKGYDRFGLGALEYALDCYKAIGKEKDNKVAELKKKIAEVKKKLESSAF
jgi:tetratricopeptide (TPR) repeat protein